MHVLGEDAACGVDDVVAGLGGGWLVVVELEGVVGGVGLIFPLEI